MKLSVNATPQSVFPDGRQDIYTLTNDGPWTVFIDQDSSVSSQSIPLPATASIVWDANRPLFVVASGAPEGGSSTLILTRNGGITDASRASVDAVLWQSQAQLIDGSNVVNSGLIECSAYNTLEIRFKDDKTAAARPPTDGYTVRISFFNHSSTVLSTIPIETIEYHVPAPSSHSGANGKIHIVCPIMGAYFSVTFGPDVVAANRVTATVSATDRVKPTGWFYIDANDRALSADGNVVTASYDFYASDVAVTNNAVYLSSIRPVANIGLRWSGAITTAGTLFIQNAFVEAAVFHRITIPVGGTAAIDPVRVPLPGTNQLRCGFASPVGGGTIILSVAWSDN